MSWFSTRASRKVQDQNDRLVAQNARLVSKNRALAEALTEATAKARRLETRLAEVLSERGRANVVDAFKRQGGIVTNPLGHLQVHPNALTDAQRQDAADEARYKRHLDGLGDE